MECLGEEHAKPQAARFEPLRPRSACISRKNLALSDGVHVRLSGVVSLSFFFVLLFFRSRFVISGKPFVETARNTIVSTNRFSRDSSYFERQLDTRLSLQIIDL